MPIRQITINDTQETIFDWLSQNLCAEKCITPIKANLEEVKYTDQLRKKGIYFWFLNPEGYIKLSNYFNLYSIKPVFTLPIEGVKYELVYLGTAGTGKRGNSNLYERLKWHITDKHTKNAICYGTLSTLRAGLGTLLSEDLIITNTESSVRELMEKNMKVCWIEYDSTQGAQINNDEKNLIETLKPVLNIKNNPNARSIAHDNPTKAYRIRRNTIYKITQSRLGCSREDTNQLTQIVMPPNKFKSKYHFQIIKEDENCIDFTITKEQSIAEVIRGIEGLPIGKCKVLCYNSEIPTQLIYPSKNNNGWRQTGNDNSIESQNIYTFFANVDTKMNNRKRWEIIQTEMNMGNIQEITVKVCNS